MSTPLPAYDPTIEDGQYGFSYEYGVDIEIAGQWTPIRRITAVDPQDQPVTVEAGTYDDLGSPNAPKIGESWTLAFQVQQQRLPEGKFTPEVEALLAYTHPDAVGNLAVATVRWYDKPAEGEPNPDHAFQGRGTVQMTRAQTGNAEIGAWSVTITGQGRRTQISNPFTGWVERDGEPVTPGA